MEQQPLVSVIIPAYNAMETIAMFIKQIEAVIEKHPDQ
jgi:glycosyltransferase involved in cell wall biosynthesis